MRVVVDTTKGFSPGVPQQLFEGRYYVDLRPTVRGRTYDMAPDGQRFAFVKRAVGLDARATLRVILNWSR